MASRPSMVAMPFLLIVASFMAMLVSSKIAEHEMTKISSINLPQLPSNQLSDEKMFDVPGLQQCWASFSRIGGCTDEINLILQLLKSGGGGKVITGLMGPCCDVVKAMHEHCWPQMLLDPFFIKVNFFCAHHHHSIPKRPTPVGPPLPAPQVPAPAPAPQDPSPAPAPQDPPQSPAPPQYSYPTPPAPQDPPKSPTPPQYSYPTPPAPQDPPKSPAPPQYSYPTPPAPQDPPQSPAPPQYSYPTPPGPPCSYCHGDQP